MPQQSFVAVAVEPIPIAGNTGTSYPVAPPVDVVEDQLATQQATLLSSTLLAPSPEIRSLPLVKTRPLQARIPPFEVMLLNFDDCRARQYLLRLELHS